MIVIYWAADFGYWSWYVTGKDRCHIDQIDEQIEGETREA